MVKNSCSMIYSYIHRFAPMIVILFMEHYRVKKKNHGTGYGRYVSFKDFLKLLMVFLDLISLSRAFHKRTPSTFRAEDPKLFEYCGRIKE